MSYHPEVADTPWNLQIEGDPTFAVIFGEAVQNIRTALDYLVFALIVHTRGRKPRNMTQFPLSATAGDFFSKRYQVAELPGELRRRIRKLQPYQSHSQRSTTLNQLRRLSNTDKHRLLLVTETEIGGPRSYRVLGKPSRDSIGVVLPDYLRNTELEKHVLRGEPNAGAVLYVTLIMGEKDVEADAFEVLKRLLWTATEIVDGFEDACV
jgi:hypothetical protein